MSRIGKQPIPIPEKVTVTVDHNVVTVKGPRGELRRMLHPEIRAAVNGNLVELTPAFEKKKTSALWGLERALLANMILGVAEGFERRLEIEGVGYRAQLAGADTLALSLGFSHPVEVKAPSGIVFKVEKNVIIVSGIDKALVGQIAANIRAKRPPEPYKGKGIHYLGEMIRRKAGKKAAATSG